MGGSWYCFFHMKSIGISLASIHCGVFFHFLHERQLSPAVQERAVLEKEQKEPPVTSDVRFDGVVFPQKPIGSWKCRAVLDDESHI